MINIVVDTNLLNSGSTDFTRVQFVDKITPIVDELESNDLYDTVQILIPQIVIEELYDHQLKLHTKKFSDIQFCKFPNFEIIPCDDYCDSLREKFDTAIKELSARDAKSIILPYPQNEILPSIISRALSKRPPFEGEDKKSDKGFKDVILWESVIEYKKEHPNDVMILCSRDGRLCDSLLRDEYHELFNDEIHLLKLDANNYRPIYDKLEELTKHRLTPTFEEKLKQDVLELLSEDRLLLLYIDEYFEYENGMQCCDGITLTNKIISNIENSVDDENRICITANIMIEVLFTDSEFGASSDSGEYRLDVEYSFDDDLYRLVGYESLNGGHVDIRNRDFILE